MTTDTTQTHPDAEERLDPKGRRDHEATRHWARYDWASSFLPANRVLDCACGVGYGSALLAERGAEAVVAVDVCAEALAIAKERYSSPKITHVESDAQTLDPAVIGLFDLIVSMETVEHIKTPEKTLDAFVRLLAPNGVLLISVPNDALEELANPFHEWVADYEEVLNWLQRRFKHVEPYVETYSLGTMILPANQLAAPTFVPDATVRTVDDINIDQTIGFLFVCSNTPITAKPVASATQVDGMGYYKELERTIKKIWDEHQAIAAERDSYMEEAKRLAAAWEEHTAYIKKQENRIAELESAFNNRNSGNT